jgi:hypothetical protein
MSSTRAALSRIPAMTFRLGRRFGRIAGQFLFTIGLTLTALVWLHPDGLALDDESVAVTRVLTETFDRPDAPLAVEPVVVAGDWAIAGWTQDGRGGRALLRRKGDGWAIHLCAGDALRDRTALVHMGLPLSVATALADGVAAAEATVDPARVALFASFEGVVEMNADGSHPDHGAGHGDAHGGGEDATHDHGG